ncbi:MAG: hypothetical protein QXL98_02400, partial [Thermofilaceae archaeon]
MEALRGTILDLRRKILELIPLEAEVTNIKFEGPRIAIYTRRPDIFISEEEKLIKEIVKTIKKRIVVRADQAVRLKAQEAEREIRSIVPPEAGIRRIYFNEELSEVEIEAEKPGYVIGKSGETRREIFRRTG